jgi:hypothetical protein
MSSLILPQPTSPTPAPTTSPHDQLRAALRIETGRVIAVMASAWQERKVSFRVSVVGRDGLMVTVHRLFEEQATVGINDVLWSLVQTRPRDWSMRPLYTGAGFVISHKCYPSYLRQMRAIEGDNL